MKKIYWFFCIIIFLNSCDSKIPVKESASQLLIKNMKSKFGNFQKTDTMLDGSILYLLRNNLKIKDAIDFKNTIDRSLQVMPSETKEHQLTRRGGMFDQYIWETANISVRAQTTYLNDSSYKIECRLFITEK